MVDKRLRRRTPVRLKQIRGVAEEIGNWLGEEVDLTGFLEQAHYCLLYTSDAADE